MSEYSYKFSDEDEFDSNSKGRNNSSEDAWVASFADVVTVLLCFFIIFYMIEKQVKSNRGFGPMKGSVQEFRGKATTPEVLTLVETVKQLPDVEIFGTDQFLEIHFPPASFFGVGKTIMTKSAKDIIGPVAESLKNIGDDFYIQVQGYTDSQGVKYSNKRWWKNNMELSMLRSLSVHEYLIKYGINKKNLSIAGFGANRPLEGQTFKNQRRITIKIEPKDYVEN